MLKERFIFMNGSLVMSEVPSSTSAYDNIRAMRKVIDQFVLQSVMQVTTTKRLEAEVSLYMLYDTLYIYSISILL